MTPSTMSNLIKDMLDTKKDEDLAKEAATLLVVDLLQNITSIAKSLDTIAKELVAQNSKG